MHSNFKLLLKSAFVLLALNCASQKNEYTSAIPFNKELQPTSTIALSAEEQIFTPTKLLNHNNEYLILHQRLSSDFIKVWSLPDLEYLYSWGQLGGGPSEFQYIPMYLQSSNLELILHDTPTSDVKYFEVTDSTLILDHTKTLRFDQQMDPTTDPVLIGDNRFVAEYGTSLEDTEFEHVIIELDNKEPIRFFGDYPDTELQHIERYFEFSKSSIANHTRGLFLTSYNHYNKFKIYNFSGDLKRIVDIEDDSISHLDDHNPTDYRYFKYRKPMASSNNYVYFLGFNDFNDNLFESNDPSIITSLEIWDWEGKPVHRATFDRYIRSFTVSETYDKIYAIGYNVEDTLFVYDLPKLD